MFWVRELHVTDVEAQPGCCYVQRELHAREDLARPIARTTLPGGSHGLGGG